MRNLTFLILAVAVLFMSSCKKDESTAKPTISVLPISIDAATGEEVEFTIDVTGDPLQSILLDGAVIKEYTGGEKSDQYIYVYKMESDENVSLEFEVVDTHGNSEYASASVNWKLPDVFMIADFSKDSIYTAYLDYYDTWSYGRLTAWLPANGMHSDSIMVSCRGSFNTDWAYGVSAPGGEKAMKATTGLTNWGGWTVGLFDFRNNPLPENEMKKVKSGDRVFALDVYYEDLDSEHTFSVINNTINDLKTEAGIKIAFRLTNSVMYNLDLVNGNSVHVFDAFESKITKANEWQTLYFTFDQGEKSNPDNVWDVLPNQVDRIQFVLNFGYPSAVASNYYIKDLRIVNAE